MNRQIRSNQCNKDSATSVSSACNGFFSQVTTMLGQQLTKEEVEDFMREADVVSEIKLFPKLIHDRSDCMRQFSKSVIKSTVKRNPMNYLISDL